jgi:hypothetical protein
MLAGPATSVLVVTVLSGLWALATGSLTLGTVVWLRHRVREGGRAEGVS